MIADDVGQLLVDAMLGTFAETVWVAYRPTEPDAVYVVQPTPGLPADETFRDGTSVHRDRVQLETRARATFDAFQMQEDAYVVLDQDWDHAGFHRIKRLNGPFVLERDNEGRTVTAANYEVTW